jgi:hypothetical protein
LSLRAVGCSDVFAHGWHSHTVRALQAALATLRGSAERDEATVAAPLRELACWLGAIQARAPAQFAAACGTAGPLWLSKIRALAEPPLAASAALENAIGAADELVRVWANAADVEAVEAEFVSTARFLFSTLAVMGRPALRAALAVSFAGVCELIVDEAGQAVEPLVLVALQACAPRRCLLVGDPRQLPPYTHSRHARRNGIAVSLLERLMHARGSADMLEEQHRMHPEIAAFPSAHFYDGRLRNAEELCAALADPGMTPSWPPYCFVDVAGAEERIDSSYQNRLEAEAIARVLAASGWKAANVAVLTFYARHAALTRSVLAASLTPEFRVSTVDAFQGGEAEAVIVSFVRSGGNIGFVRDFRRLNVALTRAQRSLVLIGNVDALQSSDSADIVALVKDAKDRHKVLRLQDLCGAC